MTADVSQVAVIYCRESSKYKYSLDTQEERCRAFCAEEGLTVLSVFREIHSGADLDRPVFQAALDLLRQRKAGVLVVYALDRFMRDQDGNVVALWEIEKRIGARVISATEQSGDSQEDKLLRGILSYVAAKEREKILERTSRGRRARAESGKPIAGSAPPYGYAWNADRTAYVPDPATAPIVRRIFHEVVQGRSTRAIRIGLDADGIPTPSQRQEWQAAGKNGAHWSHTFILRLIANPAYKGEAVAYRWKATKRDVLDTATGRMRKVRYTRLSDSPGVPLPSSAVPALVSPEEWQAANSQLAVNKQEAGRNTVHPKDQLVRAGFAVCGYCGRHVQVKWKSWKRADGTKGDPLPVYICSGQSHAPYSPCAGGYPSASVRLVDADVWSKVLAVLQTDALMVALTRRSLAGEDTSAQDRLAERIATYDGTLEQLKKRRSNLLRMQSDADYGSDVYAELGARVKDTTDQIKRLVAERDAAREHMEKVIGAQALQQVLRLVPGGFSADIPVYIGPDESGHVPEPGTPAFEEAAKAAAMRKLHEAWVSAVQAANRQLTVDEKRAILRFLGVRVKIYRRDTTQPRDSEHWQVLFALDALSGKSST